MDNVQRVSQFDVLVVGAGAAGLAAATSRHSRARLFSLWNAKLLPEAS